MQVTVRCPRCDRVADVEYPVSEKRVSRRKPPVLRCTKCNGAGVIIRFGVAPRPTSAVRRSVSKKMPSHHRSDWGPPSAAKFRRLGGGTYVGQVPNRPAARSSGRPKAGSVTKPEAGDDLSNSLSGSGSCSKCGSLIPEERLRAVFGTTLCVRCASTDPSGQRNRRVEETFGSRADWMRDKASWKRRR
jgi:hypothetical protein